MGIRHSTEENRKKEIEKMTMLLFNEAGNYCNADGEICPKILAEVLFNAGYRKTFISASELVDNAKRHIKEMPIIIKSELRNFANLLKAYAKACCACGYDGIGEQDIEDSLKEYLNENI